MKFVYRLKIDLTHLISNRANCQEARPAAVANLVAYGADCVEKPDVDARALPRRESHQPARPHGASDLKPGRDGHVSYRLVVDEPEVVRRRDRRQMQRRRL